MTLTHNDIEAPPSRTACTRTANTAAAAHKHREDEYLARFLPHWLQGKDVDAIGGAQSIMFMTEMMPNIIQRGLRAGRPLRILDVGPGAGFGANFLGQVTAEGFFGLIAEVSVLDIEPIYRDYIVRRHPYVREFIHGDVFDLDDTWDLVVCSHVIEHVDEPQRFLHRLAEISEFGVVFSAPFEEPRDNLCPGHKHSFDMSWLQQIGATNVRLVESAAWGFLMEPRYRMMVADLEPALP